MYKNKYHGKRKEMRKEAFSAALTLLFVKTELLLAFPYKSSMAPSRAVLKCNHAGLWESVSRGCIAEAP